MKHKHLPPDHPQNNNKPNSKADNKSDGNASQTERRDLSESSWWRLSHYFGTSKMGRVAQWASLAAALCLLLAVALPTILVPVVTWAVNHQLKRLPEVVASVDSVVINPLMSYVAVHGIKVDHCEQTDKNSEQSSDKHTQAAQRPLLRVKQLRTEWYLTDLWHATLSGSAFVDSPEVTLYHSGGKQTKENEKAQKNTSSSKDSRASTELMRWRKPFFKFIPVRLHQARVSSGTVRYVDLTCKPTFDLSARDVSIEIDNITNRQKLKDALYARAQAHAILEGGAKTQLLVKFDPLARMPRFDVHFELKPFELVRLNPLLQTYAHMQLASGLFDLYSEADAGNGHFAGYVKPMLHNVRLKVEQAPGERLNIAQRTLSRAANAVAKVLQNDKGDQMATKIAIEGNFDSPEANIWEAVATLLRNAFSAALRPGLDHSLTAPHGP